VPKIVEKRVNTGQQVSDYLDEALAIFGDHDIPDDLRVEAFRGILQLVAAKTMMQEPTALEIGMLGRG
jgi:hypothetical protein